MAAKACLWAHIQKWEGDLGQRIKFQEDDEYVKTCSSTLASVAQLVGALSWRLKTHRFKSRSVHVPRLGVLFLAGHI